MSAMSRIFSMFRIWSSVDIPVFCTAAAGARASAPATVAGAGTGRAEGVLTPAGATVGGASTWRMRRCVGASGVPACAWPERQRRVEIEGAYVDEDANGARRAAPRNARAASMTERMVGPG
jgi:hypothetical protein